MARTRWRVRVGAVALAVGASLVVIAEGPVSGADQAVGRQGTQARDIAAARSQLNEVAPRLRLTAGPRAVSPLDFWAEIDRIRVLA